MLSEKAKSKAQQRFFGMVRATQKGEMENPSPEITKVASSVSKSDVKKMASTKHKGLPEKKEIKEVWGAVAKVALGAAKGAVKQKAKQVVVQKAKRVVSGDVPQPNMDEGVGRAAIGAGVGALVGGPVGAAAGAAIGASLGKKKVTGGNKVKKKATNFFKAEPKVTSSEEVKIVDKMIQKYSPTIDEKWESAAEANRKYDRARKAAARRAAERNRQRDAGELNDGRRERETYTSSSGQRMHYKGYKAEEVEVVDEKFATQYGDKTKLSQSSQRKSLGRGASIKDGAKASGYESKKEHRDSSKKLAPYQTKGTYNAHLNTEAKKFSDLSTQRKPGEKKKPKKKREGYIFDKAQPPSKKVTNEEVGISSSAEMEKAKKEAKLRAKEDAKVASKKKVTEAKVDTVKKLDDEGKEDARNTRRYGHVPYNKHGHSVLRRSEHRMRRGDKKRPGHKEVNVETGKVGKEIGEAYRVLAKDKTDLGRPAAFSYKDEKDAKKFADSIKSKGGKATVHKEGVMDIVNRYKKKKEEKKPQKAQDAGARARRVLKRKEYQDKVSAIVPAELEDQKLWNKINKYI